MLSYEIVYFILNLNIWICRIKQIKNTKPNDFDLVL